MANENTEETVAAAVETPVAAENVAVADAAAPEVAAPDAAAVAESPAVETPTVEKLAGEIAGLNTELQNAKALAADSASKLEAAEKARSDATVKNAELEKKLAESLARVASLEAAQKSAERIAAEKYAAAVQKPVAAKVTDAKTELKAKYDSLKNDPYGMAAFIDALTPEEKEVLRSK